MKFTSLFFVFVVHSLLNLLYSDSLDVWNNPLDTMSFNIVFRGDFNRTEKYKISFLKNSKQHIFIKGKGGYSYHYYSVLDEVLSDTSLESNIEIYQIKMFSKRNIIFKIPPRIADKNILYFERVRSPKTGIQFDVKWINAEELKAINWLDYCRSRNYLNGKRLKIDCLII